MVKINHNISDLPQMMAALLEGETDTVANLANASALLFDVLPDVNWAGFYFLKGDCLVLGPFQGKPACVRLPLGKGVCSAAVQRDQVVVVPDVYAFAGHIACDSASRSEVVFPLHREGRVVAVLDIDSPVPDRFAPIVDLLSATAANIERSLC